jgi:hypothetical protein
MFKEQSPVLMVQFAIIIIVPHEVVGIVEELALELVGVLLLGGSPGCKESVVQWTHISYIEVCMY